MFALLEKMVPQEQALALGQALEQLLQSILLQVVLPIDVERLVAGATAFIAAEVPGCLRRPSGVTLLPLRNGQSSGSSVVCFGGSQMGVAKIMAALVGLIWAEDPLLAFAVLEEAGMSPPVLFGTPSIPYSMALPNYGTAGDQSDPYQETR